MSSEDDLWPEGYSRRILDRVDSTSAEAMRLAPGLKRPTWILAHHQTAARGRQGRSWSMPAGNFAASLAMRPACGAGQAALRSFFAANALFETAALYVDRDRLSVKWPNDVLLDGGKLAGILLESTGTGDLIDWLVIGIGVNLAQAPGTIRDAAFPPVALGVSVTPEEFLSPLAANFATEEALYAAEGFAPIRARWLETAARLGEIISARTPREEITGRFAEIDGFGNLILETPQGPRVVTAADVYF